MAKILAVSRKSHHPIETLLLLQWAHNSQMWLVWFWLVALEHEVSPNLEKSGNVDINTKLNGKQACQACNCLLFFEDEEEP